MKILIDMNLSPDWVAVLAKHQIEAVHWSTIGDPRANDVVLMEWARENQHILFTHDLDFGAALALTQTESPSVIQARTHDVTPGHLERAFVRILRDHQSVLETGALVVMDEGRLRIRVLPLIPKA